MSLDNLSQNDQTKLKQFMDQGLGVLQEVSDLKEGLSDTAKNLAEELGCKPAILNKALRTAFKASLENDKEVLNDVESVLAYTGR